MHSLPAVRSSRRRITIFYKHWTATPFGSLWLQQSRKLPIQNLMNVKRLDKRSQGNNHKLFLELNPEGSIELRKKINPS